MLVLLEKQVITESVWLCQLPRLGYRALVQVDFIAAAADISAAFVTAAEDHDLLLV